MSKGRKERKKEKRKKFYIQRTAESRPHLPDGWNGLRTTPFPECLFCHELWHGLLKRTFSCTLSFSQLNAKLGSLD